MSLVPEPPFPDGKFVLSVVIPVYNEKETVRELIHRVRRVDLSLEIIVVDDGSVDGTRDILRDLEPAVDKLIFHERNQGKGGAIRTGIEHVTGDMVIIQDADLEYDPTEYTALITPILEGKADVVYGSRFLGSGPRRVHFYWHSIANWMLTTLSNMVTNVNLTDMETCFKVFKTEIIRDVALRENGFGIEPEITAKLARMRCVIYEVGISYYGRSYEEGKKIGFKDAVWALVCILRYGLVQRLAGPPKRPRPRQTSRSESGSAESESSESSESRSPGPESPESQSAPTLADSQAPPASEKQGAESEPVSR